VTLRKLLFLYVSFFITAKGFLRELNKLLCLKYL
jgi:hypothetical protein